jgi:hypothetical protein
MKLRRLLSTILLVAPLALVLSSGEAMAQKKKKKKKKKSEKTEEVTPAAEGEEGKEGKEGSGGGAGYKTAPYGMAGCGLGSLIMKSNTKGAQSSAATTNGYTYTTLFGIISGTSNCVDTDSETAAVEREVFISANLASLSKEAAQGEGRHLLAFADVLGCAGEESYPQFVKVSQEQHQAIFNSEDPQAVLNSYISAVKSNNQLKTECARLGV